MPSAISDKRSTGALAPSTRVFVRSAVPGRVRWDVPRLLALPGLGPIIEGAFSSQPGVISVAANPVTGRVLLYYDPARSLIEMQELLERTLDGALVSRSESELRRPRSAESDIRRHPLIKLLNRTQEQRRLTAIGFSAAFLDRLFEAGPPALIGAGVDIITRGPASIFARVGFPTVRSQLIGLGVLGAFVWTLDAAMNYFHSVASGELANVIRRDLRNEIYDKVQRLDLARIEERAITDWLGILEDDVSRIADFIEDGIDPIVTMVTNGIIVGATFLRFSPALALVQLLTIPGLYIVSTKLLLPIRQRQSIARQHEERLSATLHSDVAGIATIASFVRHESEAARVGRLGEQLALSTRRTTQLSAAYVPAVQMVVGIGFLSSLIYGGVLATRGDIPTGAYNVMAYSSLRLLAALGRLGVSLERYQRTKLALKAVLEVLDSKPSIFGGPRQLRPDEVVGDIKFDDVVFGYEPDRPVLRGLSLHFPPGKTTGIVGPTGAGKTTVLKLLLRLYDVQSGAILLDGTDIREYRLEDLRRTMAAVPQNIFLFAGTVRDNIAYANPEAPLSEVVNAARIAEADGFITALPDGYETLIGEGGARLSGGQKQRLAIARAVLADRPIILFDEATSAVDHETEAAIQRSLQDVTAGRTTVVVAHRLSTVRPADIIYVLDDGQVRETGRHDELVRKDGIYASMWRVQTGELPKPRPRRPRK